MINTLRLIIVCAIMATFLSSCKAQAAKTEAAAPQDMEFQIVGDSLKLNDNTITGWTTDYPKALAYAKQVNRPVLIDFTGSDWCGWCMKLEDEVFSKPDFQNYAKENLVLVRLDFPRKLAQTPELKKQNQELQRKYGIMGYPTIILLNSQGEKVAETGYREGGADSYVKHIQSLLKK